MMRRVLSGAGALAVVLGGAVALQPGMAAAVKTPVTLSGSITCSMTGTLKFSPALVNGGTAADTVSVKATLGSCAGLGASSGGVTLSGGRLLATAGSTVPNSCGGVLDGSSLPAMTGTVKWKGSGGHITPSSVSVTHATAVFDPNGNNGQGTVNVTVPTTVTGGSYNTETGTTSGLTSNNSGLSIEQKCGRSNGVRAIGFGKPAHTLTGSITISGGV